MRFDVIIIGGGISGLGVAHEAARAGKRVLVIERGAVCAATSANSLRIIHGGFRYLQQLDLRRVVTSLRDQARVAREFSEYTSDLRCLMPLSRFGLRSALPLRIALGLYGALSRRTHAGSPRGRLVKRSEVPALSPVLESIAPHGAFEWRDLLLSDPRGFERALVNGIAAHGGLIEEQCEVLRVARNSGGASVHCRGSGGHEREISARAVVSCTGPWIERLEVDDSLEPDRPPLGWCKAFNLVIARKPPSASASAAYGPERRLYFFVPRGDDMALGTAYVPAGAEHSAQVSEPEIAEFITGANRAFPALALARNEISAVESGLLPCDRRRGAGAQALIGQFQVYGRAPFIEVLSTKYTTFFAQAREVLERLEGGAPAPLISNP